MQLLLLRGYAFNHTADFETVRMMKENLCFVGYNIEAEQKLANETTVLVESYTVMPLKTQPKTHLMKTEDTPRKCPSQSMNKNRLSLITYIASLFQFGCAKAKLTESHRYSAY